VEAEEGDAVAQRRVRRRRPATGRLKHGMQFRRERREALFCFSSLHSKIV
jgi:hypothetical protein